MTPKRSAWIDGSVKPVRKGLYDVDVGHGKMDYYRRWNGERWEVPRDGGGWFTALYQPDIDGGKDFKWRGLAHPPSSKGGEK